MPGKTGLLLRGIPVRQFLIVKKKKKPLKYLHKIVIILILKFKNVLSTCVTRSPDVRQCV